MSVYYKFNSELKYSYIDFDGLHISVADLKKSIVHQKRLGKIDFDLLITNAQTKEEYAVDTCLIPKNTSLIIARIPLAPSKRPWETPQQQVVVDRVYNEPEPNIDLSRMHGSEEDKIQAMIQQSTIDYDPTKFGKHSYQRVRGSTQVGEVPANYRCYKCHKPGHWIKNCPLNLSGKDGNPHHIKSKPENKKMTGIPRTFIRDKDAEEPQFSQVQYTKKKQDVPEDLICAICKNIFTDAVMIPCCGSSFCDECVRTSLLESEENECPDCKEKGTNPGSLIPNRFLRNAVNTFLNESNNLVREIKKNVEHPMKVLSKNGDENATENVKEKVADEILTDLNDDDNFIEPPIAEKDSTNEEEENVLNDDDLADEEEYVNEEKDSDDDDNITVTVPPAHLQSRGAQFRDRRVRKVLPPNMEPHEAYPSIIPKAAVDVEASTSTYDEEENTVYNEYRTHKHQTQPEQQRHMTPIQSTHIDESHNSNMSLIPSTYVPNQNMYQPNAYQMNHNLMHPQMYPQSNYHPGSQSQQFGGHFSSMGNMRPVRYDMHHGNYPPNQIRHQVARPQMHDHYLRPQRTQVAPFAAAITQNIQQRFGTGIIEDPLEAFNRIMREKELRKERNRRSRSYDRKRSPHYSPNNRSPDNHRMKNSPDRNRRRSTDRRGRKRSNSYNSNSSRTFSRSRSRSRKRAMRRRSRSSRSISLQRYNRERRDPISNKDHHRERSPDKYQRGRRVQQHSSTSQQKNPRGNFHRNNENRNETYHQNYAQPLTKSNDYLAYSNHSQFPSMHYDKHGHEHQMNQLDALNSPSGSLSKYEEKKIDTLDQQPPPPGFEVELNTELPDNNNLFTNLSSVTEVKEVKGNVGKKSIASDDESADKLKNHASMAVVSSKSLKNVPSTTLPTNRRRHGSREKKRDSSSDDAKKDKKSREKKKRKKSKDVDKKKNKKDRKDKVRRSEKDKWEQKSENGYQASKDALVDGSNLITSTTTQSTANIVEKTNDSVNSNYEADSSQTDFIGDDKEHEEHNQLKVEQENYDGNPNTKPDSPSQLNHSDSILDIYSNMDYDMEFPEWSAPEISRWERDETNTGLNPIQNPSQSEAEKSEMDEKNKPLDEKVTTEIIKRAENAIFTRAINAIRPIEMKTSSIESQQDKIDRNKLSPIRTFGKQMDEQITSEFKPEIFQVTTDDETGLRSVVELLASEQTDQSRNSSVRVSTSVKDRLGKKVIKTKSRSRSPKAVKVKVNIENKGFQSRSRDKSARSSKEERSYGTSSSSRNNESNRQHVFVSSVSSKSSIDRRGGGEDRRDSHTIDRSRINRNDLDFSRNVRNQNSSSSSSKRTSKVDKVGHSPNAREITRDHNTRGTSKHKVDKNQTESLKIEKEKYQQKKDIESARKPELQPNKNDTRDTKDARHSSSSHVTKSSTTTTAAVATKESKTPKKHTRSSSTSSCSSTQSGNSNASSAKQTKKHSSYKTKSKKKYRSSSTESILKRKKVKKIKKSKKKKTRK